MRKARKTLTMVLAFVLVAALSVAGTVAYLTSTTQEVKNTFTVGKVAIDLDEAKTDAEGNGVIVTPEERVKENSYKLMPGHTYSKDPTVTVKAGSEESYIRILVTIDNMTQLKAALGSDFLPQNFVTGWDNSVWETTREVKTNGDSATYEFRYVGAANKGTKEGTVAATTTADIKLAPLFTNVVIPGTASSEDMANLSANTTVTIIAQAIQSDGFDDADAAWAAFNA